MTHRFSRSLHLFLLLILFTSFHLGSEEPHDFFMMTIPKSGTHLMTKLLTMLTDRHPKPITHFNVDQATLTDKEFETMMINSKASNHFVFAHTNRAGCGDFFMRFGKAHPEYVQILQIRDLRDLIISYIFYRLDKIKVEMGGDPSFDEILTAILSRSGSIHGQVIERNVNEAIAWMHRPGVFVSKFEDLVGSDGGGSDKLQKQAVLDLASKLGIKLSHAKLKDITYNLFGDKNGPPSATFRKGKIGEWRKYFNHEQIQLFKKNWGSYQRTLGYSVD